jgi:hypothetical protein
LSSFVVALAAFLRDYFSRKKKKERERDWPKHVIRPDSKRNLNSFFFFHSRVDTFHPALISRRLGSPQTSGKYETNKNWTNPNPENTRHTHTKEKA